MYTHRLTFSIDAIDADTLYQLAQRYNIPLAEIVRESVRRLLADLPAYEQTLTQRLVERHSLPTDEQRANFERYRVEHAAIDLDALFASLPPPPEL
jgi:hypothetical protein